MNTTLADQRMLLINPAFSMADAQQKAWLRKIDAFGTFSKMTGFLSKPKDEDFELIYSEERYEPLWHVAATARYVFDRNNRYIVPFKSSEVQSITFEGNPMKGNKGSFEMTVVEHCQQDCSDEALVDGLNGKSKPELRGVISAPHQEIEGEINKALSPEAIVVPPQFRISAIIRNALSKVITGVEADVIHEESLAITTADLYYHPIYAFQYHWKTKDKKAIVEVDGINGEIRTGTRTYSEYFGKIMDKDFLMDVGADAAGMIIPGGSIAVRFAQKCVDSLVRKGNAKLGS